MRSVPVPDFTKRLAEHIIGARGKKLLKYLLFRSRLALGAEPFASMYGLDRMVLPHLPERGFFVEAGANDGFSNSDTYYLEKARGWNGLLVEPVPQIAAFARSIRSAPVVVAALGSFADDGQQITMSFADSTSQIGGSKHIK